MSFLRRRRHRPEAESLVDTTERIKTKDGEDICLVPVSKLEAVAAHNGRKRRQGLVFMLGGLFGLLLAAFFADRNDMINLASLPDLADFNFEGLAGILPAGLLNDAKDRSVCLSKWSSSPFDQISSFFSKSDDTTFSSAL
jgi:phospholipid:diacylglycerol acyltransferase